MRLDKLETFVAKSGRPLDGSAPLFASLLSIPTEDRYPPLNLSPHRQKEKTLQALLARIEVCAARGPVLIIFEDAHWADPVSLEFLELIVDRAPKLKLLVLITLRPDFALPGIDRSHAHLLTLNRLPASRAVEVIGGLTSKALPTEVIDRIVARADGVPLFIEELTKTVVESDVLVESGDRYTLKGPITDLEIPATLQGALLARLDRLPAARGVAQICAALGRSFSHELISAVAEIGQTELDETLAQLVNAALILRRGSAPNAEYTFKHSLVQEAAHATLVRASRKRLHARIVETLERNFPEIVDTQPDFLVRHSLEAQMTEKAIGYCLRAGQQANARGAMTEAIAHISRGLDLISAMVDDNPRRELEIDLQITLGRALQRTNGYAARESIDAFARARTLCEQLGQPPMFPVLVGQYAVELTSGAFEQAMRHAEQTVRLGEQQKNLIWECSGWEMSGYISLYTGDFPRARASFEIGFNCRRRMSAAEASGRTPDWDVTSPLYFSRCLWCLGYFDLARQWRAQALAEARQRLPYHRMFALCHVSLDDWLIGGAASTPSMLGAADEISAISRECGFPLYVAVGNILRGSCLSRMGRTRDGIPLLVDGLNAYRDTGAGLLVPYFLAILAESYGIAAKPSQGLERLVEATDAIGVTKEGWIEAEISRVQGDLLLAAGDGAGAERSYAQAIAISRRQQATLLELRAATSLATAYVHRGKPSDALGLLGPVCKQFDECDGPPILREARVLLRRISAEN
jgi:hypothetical protein